MRLKGKRVLVTRARIQAQELSSLLTREGAEIIEVPTIDIVLLNDGRREVVQSFQGLDRYRWLILTSVNTVKLLDDVLKQLEMDWSMLGRIRIACIGSSTARAVENRGARVHIVPDEYRAEGLIDSFSPLELKGAGILLPRAAASRAILPEALQKLGATVHEIHLYEAVIPEGAADMLQSALNSGVDYVTFTSSSTVHHFMQLKHDMKIDWKRTAAASIGPITSGTLRDYDVHVSVESPEFTIAALAEAIARHSDQNKKRAQADA